jgi:hypothetical protein
MEMKTMYGRPTKEQLITSCNEKINSLSDSLANATSETMAQTFRVLLDLKIKELERLCK